MCFLTLFEDRPLRLRGQTDETGWIALAQELGRDAQVQDGAKVLFLGLQSPLSIY